MSEKPLHTLDPNNWAQTHADYLFNYTITRVNNEDLAKDIVQETFFSALKAQENYRGQAAERTWLISILKRKMIDYYRKINSKKGKAEVRMVFLLKTVENYETEEICNELDITASNLWVIIHRARHQLRKCLEENWFAK